MLYAPAVFAVEGDYQILIRVDTPSLLWVRVNGRDYFDDANGVLRSDTTVHRVTVPMAELDAAKGYTVVERQIPNRKAYRSELGERTETVFTFRPVPRHDARAYLLSDAHCRVQEPIRAVQAFGDVDFLLFNGDVPENSDYAEHFDTLFAIADAVTGGEKPMAFARGNHDLRGKLAERYTDYTPNDRGCSYYTFRMGHIWGVALDCGEDKADDNIEYGGTICCHAFRERETRFLERVVSDRGYEADGIHTRIVLVHHPFSYVIHPPFDIEQDIYSHWSRLLRDNVRPDVMLSGHLHHSGVFLPGGEYDDLGQPCPLVVAGEPRDGWYSGAGLTFGDDALTVTFTDSDGNCLQTHTVPWDRSKE